MDILDEAEEVLIRSNEPPVEDKVQFICGQSLYSDAEARVLAYEAAGGDIDLPIGELADMFRWSRGKAQRVIAAMEGKGQLRRPKHGKRQEAAT